MPSDIGEEIVWSEVLGWPSLDEMGEATPGLIGKLAEANGYPIAEVSEPDGTGWPKKKKKNPATGEFETIVQNPNDEINAADGPNKDIVDTAFLVATAIQQFCEAYFTLIEDHEALLERFSTAESAIDALEARVSSLEGE